MTSTAPQREGLFEESLRQGQIRHALKTALACCLATALTYFFHLAAGEFAPIFVVIIMALGMPSPRLNAILGQFAIAVSAVVSALLVITFHDVALPLSGRDAGVDLHLPAFHQSVSPAGEHGQHGVRHRYLRIFPGDRRGDAGVLRRLRNRLVRGRLLGHRGQYPDLAAHHRKGLSGTAGCGLRPVGRAVPAGGPADSFRRVAAGGSVRRGVGALPAAAPDAGARVAPWPGHFQSLRADGPCLPGTEPAPVVIQSGRRPGAACGPTGRNALATGRPYRRMR